MLNSRVAQALSFGWLVGLAGCTLPARQTVATVPNSSVRVTDPAAPLTYADGARAKKLADAQCRGRVRTSIYDRFDDAGAAWVFPGGCA
jgi:hypothetical protein